MEKVVLIEDRPDRMAHLCNKKGLKLENSGHLKVFSNEEIKILEQDLEVKNFQRLNNFEVVMTHQSAWSQVQLSSLKEYCEDKNRPLVFFSGGVSSSHLHVAKPPILTMGVDEFYSTRLVLFLDDFFENGTPNLLVLQYGNKWKLNLLMEARNNLSVFLSKNEGIKSLDYYEDAVGIPKALFSMSDEWGLNLEWYENGIAENAETVLLNLKNTLSKSIKKEVFSL